MRICTIVAKNYIAQARVLAESFREHNPDGVCSVLVVDEVEGYVDRGSEPFELITPRDLGLPEFERMAACYDVTELSTAVKPWLLRMLLARPGTETVTYLDPDIEIFGSLEEIESRVARHRLVLIPHFTEPLPRDGRRPSETDILLAGTYNLGFISLGDGEEITKLLDWWSERLREDCIIDPERGYFVDQRWIDLVPGFVPDLYVLRDPGYNVAYWNLPTREITSESGRYLVNGRPLRFFHFSGFNPLQPDQLSKHQDRIDLRSSPALAELCSSYARACLDRGSDEASNWRYEWDYLPDGTRLDRLMRRLYRHAVATGQIDRRIFEPAGCEELFRYLNEPSPNGGSRSGVTRYLRSLWESRPDLQGAFPDLDGEDGSRFLSWARESADIPISPRLLPDGESPAAPRGGDQPTAETDANLGEEVAAPPTVPSGPVAPPPDADSAKAQPPIAALEPVWGANVAGYLNAELGVGEAARQLIAALDATDFPVTPIGIEVESSRMDHAFDHQPIAPGPFALNLICVNADMTPLFAQEAGDAFFERRHSIGLWFWEVGLFPERWSDSFDCLDEVWTASQHVADALSPVSPVPVFKARLPVVPSPAAVVDRASLGMPEHEYCFLFVFDYNSVVERKNPLELIEAFRLAFPAGAGPSLVLKTINGERHPDDANRIHAAASGHPDVYLIEDYVPAAVKSAMIASCDCYVSLHRSEGFGLTLAEAMYFAKPVIATGYSGNLDFMSPWNSYLVDYELKPIGPGADPYPPEGEWAQPSLEHAADLMRRAFEDREEAASRGRRAAGDIRRTHSPRAAGTELRRRLETIREMRHAHAAGNGRAADSAGAQIASVHGSGPEPRALVEHLLSFPEPPPRKGAGPVRRVAKRAWMRILRPYGDHQRRVDHAFLSSLDQLAEGSRQQTAARLQERQLDRAETLAGLRRRDQALASLREEVNGLLAHTEQKHRTTHEALAERSRELDELRVAVAGASSAVEDRLSELAADWESRLGLHGDEISGAVDQLATEMRQAVASHAEHVDATHEELATQLSRTGESIGTLTEALRSIRSGVEEASRRATAGVQAQAEEIEKIRRSLRAALAQTGDRVTALERGLDSSQSGQERLSERSEALARRIDAVRLALNDASARTDRDLRAQELEMRTFLEQQLEGIRGTVGELSASTDEALRSHSAELGRMHSQLSEAVALVAESRAVPYMQEPAFETFEHPSVGTVSGFHGGSQGNGPGGYREFEDLFRGSEEMVRERQRVYLELLDGREPVLDAGCGRGEFLDLLKEAGVAYTGVDLAADMVERCRAKGHDRVRRGDLNAHLKRVRNGSLGVVFSSHVVEHLEYEELHGFITLSLRKLKTGGLFVAETVNPHSARALKTFWVDPTHEQPLFPETLLALCRMAGFEQGYVFHPNGDDDVEADRFRQGEYALVARTPDQVAG